MCDQCSECGYSRSADGLTEIAFDDDGGEIMPVYICVDCLRVAEIDNYWIDQ